MGARRYEGKVALVTGAATGIGRAVVEGLAREGAMVAFSDLQAEPGEALAKSLGGSAVFYRSNGVIEAEVRDLVTDVARRFGRLDVAINNVGNMAPSDRTYVRIHENDEAGFDATIALSLKSNFLAMKYEIIQMLQQGGGVIANAASLAGLRVAPGCTAAYHAAKSGVIHLSEVAAVQYAADNIRVNAVAPGFTFTDAVSRTFPTRDDPRLLAAIAEVHAAPRVLDPTEVAAAYLWLCSDDASGVTGTTIPVDCGWRAR